MYSQHPKMAKKWEAETPAGKLPEHVEDPEKKKKKAVLNALGQLMEKGK